MQTNGSSQINPIAKLRVIDRSKQSLDQLTRSANHGISLVLSFIPLKTGSPISKLVLLKLADNADARGVCFPSLNYLAQYCEVSVRTVKRHVNELEKQGFV